MSQLKTLFATRKNDVNASIREFPLGCLRIEIDDKEPITTDPESIFPNMTGYLWRERRFRYVQNVSGGTLAKDSLVSGGDQGVASVTTNGGSTTTATRETGSFITDGVQVGDVIAVDDDAGGAGAAPEGEISVVTAVEPTKVTFAPALTTAIASGDIVAFSRPWTIKAATAGVGLPHQLVGIPVADIPNGQFGWIQVYGLYPNANVVAAGTAIFRNDALYAGNGVLTPVAPALTVGTPDSLRAGVSYVPVAFAVQGVRADTARRKAMVFLWGA